jgi:hypothetical protein
VPVTITKVQIFHNWGARGWSEVWYTPLLPTDATLGPLTKTYTNVRTQLFYGATATADVPLPTPVYYRVSDINAPNASEPRPFPEDFAWSRAANSQGDRRNWPYCSIRTSNGTRRRFLFKGAPDAWVNKNPNTRYAGFGGALLTAFNRWLAAVKAAGWQPLIQVPSTPYNVTAATIDTNGYLNVTTTVPTPAINSKVKIKGMRGSGTRKLNGTWRVKDVLTGGVLVLSAKKCDPCTFNPENKGQLYTLTPTLGSYQFPDVVSGLPFPVTGFSSGKLGRAFSPELGKAKACCK